MVDTTRLQHTAAIVSLHLTRRILLLLLSTRQRKSAVAMGRENPQLLLWTGDIVNVNEYAGPKPEDKTNVLRNGLERWRQIMAPLYEHATVLPVRGNHEVGWLREERHESVRDR